jgi:hypothetical protein
MILENSKPSGNNIGNGITELLVWKQGYAATKKDLNNQIDALLWPEETPILEKLRAQYLTAAWENPLLLNQAYKDLGIAYWVTESDLNRNWENKSD